MVQKPRGKHRYLRALLRVRQIKRLPRGAFLSFFNQFNFFIDIAVWRALVDMTRCIVFDNNGSGDIHGIEILRAVLQSALVDGFGEIVTEMGEAIEIGGLVYLQIVDHKVWKMCDVAKAPIVPARSHDADVSRRPIDKFAILDSDLALPGGAVVLAKLEKGQGEILGGDDGGIFNGGGTSADQIDHGARGVLDADVINARVGIKTGK